ncbi:MAG: PH domain-containing protein [Chloroflexi bacterium]|nr:PH domain-containing protein [Chloroflexota bacterium]
MERMVPIRFTDLTQEDAAIQHVAAEIAKILTPSEEILYIARQNQAALSPQKDCVVATTNRLILYRPHLLGRVDFADLYWQDVRNLTITQGVVAADFVVETVDGRTESIGWLDKDQARRIYGISQQLEQEWREKRRVREMEEARARSGGIVMATSPGGASGASPGDPVARLAKARAMLDQGLISEAEYETVKAKILGDV